MKVRAAGIALLFVVLAACGVAPQEPDAVRLGPIPNEPAAITAARRFTILSEPLTVVEIDQGEAGALHSGPSGMTINEAQAAAKRAKQARPAWLVVLTGRDARECDGDGCAQDLMRHDLVIDRETGELLYQVIQMAVQPPVRDIECNPAICPGMSPDP